MSLKAASSVRDLLGNKYILIIEPTVNYKNSMKGFLSNLKVTHYKIVSTVRDAKVSLLSLDVGLFISEWGLKDTNGIQFCREIKENPKYKGTPFLILSPENLRKDVVLASEVGIDGYLLKPFSYEEFCESVLNAMKSKRTPNIVNRLIDEAHALLRVGEVDKAKTTFEQARTQNPTSARALHGLAMVADRQGEALQAIQLFKQAHLINPDYVEALRDLIEALMVRGPQSDLIEYANRAHQASPENPKYSLILAKAYLEEEDFDLSERYFRKALRYSPKLAQAYKGLGQLYSIQEDYDQAMKNFEKALDLDEGDVSLLNSLGTTYVKLGKYKDGIDKYLAALKIKPSDFRIMFNLGYAKEKTGDIESARFFYQQALSHNPEFDKAQRRLKKLMIA